MSRISPEIAAEIKYAVRDAVTPEAKAQAVETLIWDHCRSPEKVVYCFVLADRLDRVRFDDIAASAPDPEALEEWQRKGLTWKRDPEGRPEYFISVCNGISVQDKEAYEDSVGSTGLLLSGLTFKYLATLDPLTLQRAHEIFEGLYAIYELGLQEEPGWIPKPYGFKCTGQSSMDNQCPYYQSLLRYYRIAPPEDKEKILRVLKDEMGYWMRHKYAMHRDYFGLMVDYKTEKFYPGHWPLVFLPLCHGLWRITGEQVYADEYQWLLARLDIEGGRDPEYLRKKVGCFHRFYYQYGALLEFGAEPRDLLLRGLGYQVAAIKEQADVYSAGMYDLWHHAWTWLTPRSECDRTLVCERLMAQDVQSFCYKWPAGTNFGPAYAFRAKSIYAAQICGWFELMWKGKLRGDW